MVRFRLPHFSTSIYGLLLWRLLLSLAVLLLSRVIFGCMNADLLHMADSDAVWRAFGGGLRFDLAALVYLNAPMLLMHLLPFRFVEGRAWQRATAWVYFVPNLLALAANLADVIYFDSRSTAPQWRCSANLRTTTGGDSSISR